MAKENSFENKDEHVEFKHNDDIQSAVFRQIQRCEQAITDGDEGAFANSVNGLFCLLPKENRKHIEDNKEKYVEIIDEPVYQYSCGHPMGTLENPVYRNLPSAWNYDANVNGGMPVLVSPIVEPVERTNYMKLFQLILDEFEIIGITWKTEPRDKVDKKIKAPNTPLINLKDGSQAKLLIEKGLNPDKHIPPKPDDKCEDDEDSEDKEDE
jgi:hypothetical protein